MKEEISVQVRGATPKSGTPNKGIPRMCLAPDGPQIEQKMDPPPAEAPAPLASPYSDDDMNSGLSGLRVATRSNMKIRGKGSPAGKPASSTQPPATPSTTSSPSKGIQPVSGSGGGRSQTNQMEL